jgi:hypothetical protein
MRKKKDSEPDPDPYLRLMDPDPDSGELKTYGFCGSRSPTLSTVYTANVGGSGIWKMFGSGLGSGAMDFLFSFEHAVFFKTTYFRFRSVNRKCRNDRYIDGTMNPASIGNQDRI